MTTQLLAMCVLLASHTYQVPPAAIVGILHVEGGRVGQAVGNTNGSQDLGPMQVNTIWMPKLAQIWGVDKETAKQRVRDNGCVNVHVGAWILKQRMIETGSLHAGIAAYHSYTPALGRAYAGKVYAALKRLGLIKDQDQG